MAKQRSRYNEPVRFLPPKVYIRESGEIIPMTDGHRKVIAKRAHDVFLRIATQQVMKEMGM